MSTPFGANRTRLLARWLGALYLLAGIVSGVSILFPAAPYANIGLSCVISGTAFAMGVLILSGTFNRLPFSAYRYVLAFGTMLAAVGSYAGGSPLSGAQFFFIWIIPYAFAFSTLGEAVGQTVLMAASYGVVLAIQEHQHPLSTNSGLIIGMWVIVVASEFVVGTFVRRLSRSLRDVDLRFEQAYEASPVGAAFLGSDLVWREVNDSLCMMFGRPRAQLVGMSILDITHVDDRVHVRSMLMRSIQEPVEFEARYIHPDGHTVWAMVSSAPVSPEMGEPYLFSQLQNITEHKQDREILAHQAIHDPLTGLFNRTLLLDRLVNALRHDNGHGSVAVVLLDLDQFKVVNDSLGHHVGDQLLSAIAPLLTMTIEPTDTLARFGGDEFVVLCTELATPLDAISRADRIVAALNTPINLSGSSYVVHASVGVAVSTDVNDDAATLLRDADAAMYRAKATGRNRIELFNRSMRDEAVSRLRFGSDLRSALSNGQIVIAFQPVVDINNGKPVLLEALARWNHPTRGLLLPHDFIPFAEEQGFIDEIGLFVLSESLKQLSIWQQLHPSDPPLSLSVNVSGRQFDDDGFCRKVAELLRTIAIVPGTLAIELTESVLIEHKSSAEILATLKDLGVVIILDDFGTGYSSLAYLERFPIDILKIDKSFVARVDEGPKSTVILSAILQIAHALEIGAIAEGIEHESRINRLREFGCTLVQGNAISRPLYANEVPGFLEERRAVARAIDTTEIDE